MGHEEIHRKLPFRLVLFFFLVSLFSVAGAMGAAEDYLHFRRISPEDGLPAEQVLCSFQDSRGFLWFGTSDGLVRYDSHEFRVFRPDPKDPHSLGNGNVSDIEEDAQGNLWIATQGGLDLWHRDTERFSHFRYDPANPNSLSEDRISSILLDPDGSLWVGTWGAGLNHFDPRHGKCERFLPTSNRRDHPSVSSIHCLHRDRKGHIWIGTGNEGLYQMDPQAGSIRGYQHDSGDTQSLSHNHVSAIAEDSDGYLWVGTNDGVSRLDPERRSFERFFPDGKDPASLPSRIVDAVLVDSENKVWIGTDGGGLSRYLPTTRNFVHYRHAKYAGHTLASDVVRSIFQDRAGDYWVGHFPDGLSYANRLNTPFQIFRSLPQEKNTLSDEHIMSFLEDPAGDLWVGTDNGGLNHRQKNSGQWTSYRPDPGNPQSLGGKSVLTLLCDHDNRIWVGTWGGGLNRLESMTGSFRRYLPDPNKKDSLSSLNVWRLLEDNQHRLWVATSGGGLDCYLPDQDRFIHHRYDSHDPRSLNSDYVSSLLLSRNGTLWVGTTNGLARWAPEKQSWDRFQSQPGKPGTLSNNDVIDLIEDREGILWVTTGGGGLNRLDPNTSGFENFRVADGLPSDVLRGILQDEQGMLWIASNQGLARLDPHTHKIRIFDEDDGLPGKQFTSNGRLRLRSGSLVFGTTQGFVLFDPKALQANPQVPPVVLTDFEILNRPILPGSPDSLLQKSITEVRRLEIPMRFSVISFKFSALNYRSSKHNQYLFQLEGFDENWRRPGSERRASYTNLDPGSYLFRVMAGNRDGIWNETGVQLEIVIIPPWWRTRWFLGAVILILLAGAGMTGWIISTIRHRIRWREENRERLMAQERERATAEIAETDRKYRELVENANSIILRWTREGRILFLNEFGQLFFGFRADEICGRQVIGTIVPETESGGRNLQALMNQICADPKSHQQIVNENICQDGKRVWITWTNKLVLDPQGQVVEILSIGTDITARKQIEEELRETQTNLERRVAHRTAELAVAKDRAEAADRLKSAFLATMSHELRTPLNSIIGFTGILLQGLAGPLNPEQHKQLEMVQGSGRHLLALINDVLDISKIEAGQLEVASEGFDLRASITKMVGIVSPLAEKKNLALRMELAPEIRTIKSDRRRIEQVLLNLLNNAIKFTERGEVVLQAERIPEKDSSSPSTVLISIIDTGIGIKSEDLHKLFQPFRQVSNGLSRNHEGTGLGLAICRRLLDLMGGEIRVESEWGKGSRFYVTLPQGFSDDESNLPE